MALDINLNAMLDELEYTIQQSQNDPDLIYDENIYGGVDLSTIDPCRNHYNDEYTKKPVNFKTESNIDNEIIYSPKCQKPYKNDFDPNMTKIQEFLTLAEDYFVKNGIEDIFPRGLNDDQKIIMLFYNLFKQLLVHTIEIMYLTAKNMGLSIPESIYDILKICRFSYHGSLELYDDIGDHTKFHPYFYEHVLKSSLNIICTTKMASDSESFLVAIKVSIHFYNLQ
ncbi:hypothetical protein HZS_6126 [Henneguya salminicola]|nr:hypothetical protein HZS_6126 [Henneguya salminicola]